MKDHPPRREIPEWSPRVEFEVTEVELKVEVELLDGVEEGGGREYLREQEYTRFLRFSRIYWKTSCSGFLERGEHILDTSCI